VGPRLPEKVGRRVAASFDITAPTKRMWRTGPAVDAHRTATSGRILAWMAHY
jgi:hypothetical protein